MSIEELKTQNEELNLKLAEKEEMNSVLSKKNYNLEFLLDISKSDFNQAVADMKRENQKNDEDYESLKKSI